VDSGCSTSSAHRVDRLLDLLRLPGASSRIRYLLGSHDTAHDNEGGLRAGYRHFVELAGGRESWHARAKARLGWALAVCLPGTPMGFMGTESHQAGYWHPRDDANALHGDHRFDWMLAGDHFAMEMRALVADANQLWWNHPELRQAELRLVHVDRDNGVVAFLRPGQGERSSLVVINAGESSWPDHGYRIPWPGAGTAWHVVLDTQARTYGGDGLHHDQDIPVVGGGLRLSLPR
jgi:1,4-alpha-glucan branching enzyme